MSFNLTLRNPGTPHNLNFGGDAVVINSFYYDVATDGIYAKQIVENSGFAEMMRVTPTGIVYLKGTKQINGSFSKRFELTITGDLIARAFTVEIAETGNFSTTENGSFSIITEDGIFSEISET
jgi:hypothetical protein